VCSNVVVKFLLYIRSNLSIWRLIKVELERTFLPHYICKMCLSRDTSIREHENKRYSRVIYPRRMGLSMYLWIWKHKIVIFSYEGISANWEGGYTYPIPKCICGKNSRLKSLPTHLFAFHISLIMWICLLCVKCE